MTHAPAHIIWCFVKGFGALTATIAICVVGVWAFAKVVNFISARTHWNDESIALTFILALMFLLFGTIISLGICGVLK